MPVITRLPHLKPQTLAGPTVPSIIPVRADTVRKGDCILHHGSAMRVCRVQVTGRIVLVLQAVADLAVGDVLTLRAETHVQRIAA